MARKRGVGTQIHTEPKYLRSGRDINTPIASFNEANLHAQVSQPGRSRVGERVSRHSHGSPNLPRVKDHLESTLPRQPQSIGNANVRRQSIFTSPLLGHHDGFGTRVDGLGTPSIAQESETSHAMSGYGSMPPSCHLSTIQPGLAFGCVNAPIFNHSREPETPKSQTPDNGEVVGEIVVAGRRSRVPSQMNGVCPRGQKQNILDRHEESNSSDDDDSSGIAATPGQGPGGEMMNIYLGVGVNSHSDVRRAEPATNVVRVSRVQPDATRIANVEHNILSSLRAHASPIVDCHELNTSTIQRKARRASRVNFGINESLNSIDNPILASVSTIPRRRQRSIEYDGDQVGSMRRRSQRYEPVDERGSQSPSRDNLVPENADEQFVEPNDRGDATKLDGQQSSRNRSLFSHQKRISDFVGEERIARNDYERNRKREWRAKKKAMTGVSPRARIGRGSISLLPRPQLQLFEGMPYSHSHSTLVRELSKIVRSELKSFRYVDPTHDNHVTKEEIIKIHTMLGEKYENGKDLDMQWTKLHLSSSLRNWRTTQRGIVSDYLTTLPPNVQNPPPPPGVSPEEMVVYSRQLVDDKYKERHETISKMATSMVKKRGCANPLGSGGVQKANAHYILHKGKVPSIDEVKAWKTEAYEIYNRRRSEEGNIEVEQVQAMEEPLANIAVGASEDMGPDWNHPFNRPKAFFDRYVLIYGWNPTDAEISEWLSNGRLPLHAL